MIAIINQAMAMGYAADQILNFIGTKIPKMMGNITQAKSSGYSAEDILKFLSGKIKVNPEKARSQYTSMERYLAGSGHKTKEDRYDDKARFLKSALGVAGTALGAYNIGKQLKGSLGGLSQRGQGGPQIGPQPTSPQMPTQPQMPTAQSGAMQPMGGAPIQPSEINQESEQTRINALGKFKDKIKQSNIRDQLLEQYQQNYGEGVDQNLQNPTPNQNIPSDQQTDNTTQYQDQDNAQDNFQKPAIIQEEPQQQNIEQSLTDRKKDNLKLTFGEQPPLKKGSKVITPDGDFAKVEDLPGKTAKLDIDGKKRVVEAEDVTPIPENEDEILGLYEKLIAKIPETLRSSMLNWVGYDPEKNMLQVKFHNGDSYTYEKIPPEFADALKDVAFLAKTNGGNYYGTWEQGENSRGAGVSQLIRDLQKSYGGKGKEYTGKFKEVYSFFGLPEEKLREKLEREREEKKKRKGTA